MNQITSIKIKSLLLLIIFSFNMIVGFACAVGVDMGFNNNHIDRVPIKVHVHANGKKHEHRQKPEHKHTGNDQKDDCCNDKVFKISQSDKAVPQAVKLINPVFTTAFMVAYYDLLITTYSHIHTSPKYFVRDHHPPIPDIRIAIQSFQI